MQDHTAILHVEGDTLEIDLPVLTLLRDVACAAPPSKCLPARARGIVVFALGTDTKSAETVDRSEIAWFHAPEPADSLIVDEHCKMAFSIVSLAFKGDDDKWRLYDGTSTIHAAITDAGFLSRVHNSQISFSKGDVLVCNVRMQQWQTSDGAKPNTK